MLGISHIYGVYMKLHIAPRIRALASPLVTVRSTVRHSTVNTWSRACPGIKLVSLKSVGPVHRDACAALVQPRAFARFGDRRLHCIYWLARVGRLSEHACMSTSVSGFRGFLGRCWAPPLAPPPPSPLHRPQRAYMPFAVPEYLAVAATTLSSPSPPAGA